eukprot:c40194_g1_i1.p2 GENE.c40194_g1_i1~~c40194_g1_i1.p2  ORF type:complete len:571 (+),score=142.85 c40194_g1_i1:45-1757(+)
MGSENFLCFHTRSVCNGCGSSAQRFILLAFVIALFGVGLWQAAHVGDLRQRNFDDNKGKFDSRHSNVVSGDLIAQAEFAACFTIGTGAAFFWHVLKWNSVTRFLVTLMMLGTFSVQLVTLGFASQQSQKDKPTSGDKDIDSAITSAGAAGVISCGLAFLNIILIQCMADEYLPGEGQTNCCDNHCCEVQNDCCMTETCCGLDTNCSFGRFLILATAGVYAAIFVTRASVAADLFNKMLIAQNGGKSAPNGNIVAYPMVVNIVVVSAVLGGYVVAALFHTIYMWNVTSQAIVLCVGFVAVTYEVYATGYSIKFWDEGDKGIKDQDERFDTIASLTICALAAVIVNGVAAWFFSDNFDNHIDPRNKANCCVQCGKFMAMTILFVLGLISFGLYIARAADGGQVKLDQYDNKQIHGNYASLYLLTFMFMDAGLGLGMSLFTLVHLFFWNRITGTLLGAGFLILTSMDLLTLAIGSKQQKFDADKPASQPDQTKDLTSIASLSIIQVAFSGAIAIVGLIFSCDYDDEDADRGKRSGSDEETAGSDDETATATSDDATSASGATSGATSGASGSY